MEPNKEQKKAIEHNGGVLLQAGAGSGKTFVLVEHLVYLLRQFQIKNSELDLIQQKKHLGQYLGGIVYMTFTKKAAGELQLRIQKKLRSLSTKDTFWEMAVEEVNRMTITTIDGFCFKLLSQGYFPTIHPELELVEDIQIKQKVKALIYKWFENTTNDEHDLLVSFGKNLFETFCKLFQDPHLRLKWCDPEHTNFSFENDFIELLNFELEADVINYPYFNGSEEVKNEHRAYVDQFVSLIKKTQKNEIWWANLCQFFNQNKHPRKSAKMPFDFIDTLEKIKIVRSFVLKHEEDFNLFISEKDILKKWQVQLSHLFNWVEERYFEEPSITFADIEYLVMKGLKKADIGQNIQKHFKYLVVDEFQDTSYVQYEIIKSIINYDFGKLFCVGDPKQAIYGFRGGEIEVFNQCKEQIPQVLDLSKNYRSFKSIVEFNNHVFNHLLPMGRGFSGQCRFPVEASSQLPGLDREDEVGYIDEIIISAKDLEDKLSTSELVDLEAQAILEKIKRLQTIAPDDIICLLYKKMSPSRKLIALLMQSKLSFTAQVKIPFSEEPILCLFSMVVEICLAPKKDELLEFYSYYIQQFLINDSKLQHADIKLKLTQFEKNSLNFGLEFSFNSFLISLGITCSTYAETLGKVNSLIKTYSEDLEGIWEDLRSISSETMSLDFQYGSHPHQLLIMTAHGAKGLEFDHVIVGGIFNNGNSRNDLTILGKEPASLKWKIDLEQKKSFKTPQLILEDLEQKHKDFAESKRLLYVAFTRAKKSLSWCRTSPDLKIPMDNYSWSKGINTVLDESPYKTRSEEVMLELSATGVGHQPIFQLDNLGVNSSSNGFRLQVTSELSVTRLATLVDCPRKFYLQNICKIDENELAFFDKKSLGQDDEKNEWIEDDASVVDKNRFSSMGRGTQIHQFLSNLILDPELKPDDELRFSEEKIQWIKDLFETYKAFDMVSETPIKFSFFGQMISGTPDLVLLPQNPEQQLEIWDFKTGKAKNSSLEEKYWFQLKMYAYAMYKLKFLTIENRVKISLVYVDEMKVVVQEVDWDEVQADLSVWWDQSLTPERVNLDSCENCYYGNLCHPN